MGHRHGQLQTIENFSQYNICMWHIDVIFIILDDRYKRYNFAAACSVTVYVESPQLIWIG